MIEITEGTFEWAMAMMRRGERVRRASWDRRNFIFFDRRGSVMTQDDFLYPHTLTQNNVNATDWELSASFSAQDRVRRASEVALQYGQATSADHRAWIIDQMLRRLTGSDYDRIIAQLTYTWDVGVAP